MKGKIELCKKWLNHALQKLTSQALLGRSSEHNFPCSKQNIDRSLIKKTLYELWRGKRSLIKKKTPFGCKYFILNARGQLAKFDSKVDKGIFLRYSNTSKAYRVFNSRTLVVEESIHVKCNDGLTFYKKLSNLEDDFADMHTGLFVTPKKMKSNSLMKFFLRLENHLINNLG